MKQTPKQRRRSAQRIKVRKHFGIITLVPKEYRGLMWHIANEGTLHEYQETKTFTLDMLNQLIKGLDNQ
jgi:hypothetical protein